MSPKDSAKITRKAFRPFIKKETIKARGGSKKAALNVLKYMTAEATALKSLGFRVTDSNRLVEIK